MSRIKVAFFADTLKRNIDGAVRTMYQIIDHIPRQDFEFVFFTGEGNSEELGFSCVNVPTVTLPFNNTYKMALGSLARKKIENQLQDFQPDIIHIATPSPLGSFALKFAERHNIKVSTIYHTHFLSYVDYYFRHLPVFIDASRKLLIGHMQNFYNRCDVIFVPSRNMIESLSSIGILNSKMRLWQRGLDAQMFSPLKNNTELFDKARFNVLFASRLVWEKNLKTLIDVYNQSHQMGLPYNFIIAGDGYARTALEKEMPKAQFLGELKQSELSRVYASADAFIFPSVSETYGNVVVEAMASGLPCVIAKGGGTNDFIQDMHNGIICSPFDINAYIQALEKIRNNEELKNTFVCNALSYAHSMSWEQLVCRFFEELKTLRPTSSFKMSA